MSGEVKHGGKDGVGFAADKHDSDDDDDDQVDLAYFVLDYRL